MSQSTFNTVSMSLLLVATGTLGLNILSDGLFKPEKPAKPGFAVAVSAANASTGGAAGAPAEPAKPIGEVMASADATKGAAVFKQCASCHTIEKGGPNRVGPNLWGIIGRNRGATGGFNYSAGLKGAGGAWDFANLNQFLENPKAAVAGTSMSFAGLRRQGDRADLLAYLREQADTKAALPK